MSIPTVTGLKSCKDSLCTLRDTCYRAQITSDVTFERSPRDGDGCAYYAPMEYTDGSSALVEQP